VLREAGCERCRRSPLHCFRYLCKICRICMCICSEIAQRWSGMHRYISTSQMLSYITDADAQNCALRPAQSALPSNSRKIVTPCVTTLNRTCGHLRLDTCMHRYAAQGPGSRRARQFGPCVTDPIGHGGGGGRRRKSETSKCSRREARTNRRSDRCRFPRTETSRMGATTHTSIDHFGK